MYKWIHQIIQELVNAGVREVCVCPGKRNGPLLIALDAYPEIKKFPWYEERSAAFFALGRVRATGRPVAVVTTSGTAVGECVPAAMEAYYTGDPLILLTADRPSCFRGTGAPQSAEQVGIFGPYAVHDQDLENGQHCELDTWSLRGPAHINVCLEEMQEKRVDSLPELETVGQYSRVPLPHHDLRIVDEFLQRVDYPLVVVGTLPEQDRQHVIKQLQRLQAPVYLESTSGLRECSDLDSLKIWDISKLWEVSRDCGYPIDGILRLGGVPTFRPWRDLETLQGTVDVLSVSEVPFSGLSWSEHLQMSLQDLELKTSKKFDFSEWHRMDRHSCESQQMLSQEFPAAEPPMIHALSKIIPKDSRVYLGNSLPIREWDMAACTDAPSDVWASRGLNGIDGQISTFLGLCDPHKKNWGIFGDFTALYDLAAPWILSQMEEVQIRIIVVNNGGGQIFSRLGLGDRFTNPHGYHFDSIAKLWNMDYVRSEGEFQPTSSNHQLIELIPNAKSTQEFWSRLKECRDQSIVGVS